MQCKCLEGWKGTEYHLGITKVKLMNPQMGKQILIVWTKKRQRIKGDPIPDKGWKGLSLLPKYSPLCHLSWRFYCNTYYDKKFPTSKVGTWENRLLICRKSFAAASQNLQYIVGRKHGVQGQRCWEVPHVGAAGWGQPPHTQHRQGSGDPTLQRKFI